MIAHIDASWYTRSAKKDEAFFICHQTPAIHGNARFLGRNRQNMDSGFLLGVWMTKPYLNGRWSKKFPCCQHCGTTSIPHEAKGYCEKCYTHMKYYPFSESAINGTIVIRFDKRCNSFRQYIKIDNHKWIAYARFVWEQHNGVIPKGYSIHHIDQNTMNDNIVNLACLTRSEHMAIHQKLRPIPREKCTPIFKIKEIICSECGNTFLGKLQSEDSKCGNCKKEYQEEYHHLYNIQYYTKEKNHEIGKSSYNYKLKEFICSDCGNTYLATKKPPTDRCPECRKKEIIIQRKRRNDLDKIKKLCRMEETCQKII
jgi:hypothetical protein